jgi:DNA-binding NarL/FixJ family response regulator
MTRVVVVADSGAVLADLTSAVAEVPGAYISRYGSGRARLDLLVEQVQPELVVIGDLQRSSEALARLAEVRRAAPAAKVVVMSSSASASWLADALRAEASAVLPGSVPPGALAVVLQEVIAAPAEDEPRRERGTRPAARRPARLTRRPRPVELHTHERAA